MPQWFGEKIVLIGYSFIFFYSAFLIVYSFLEILILS